MRTIRVIALAITCLVLGSALGAAFTKKQMKVTQQALDIFRNRHAKTFDGFVVTVGPSSNCTISFGYIENTSERDWPQIHFSSEQLLSVAAGDSEYSFDFGRHQVRVNGTEYVPKFRERLTAPFMDINSSVHVEVRRDSGKQTIFYGSIPLVPQSVSTRQ